MKRSPETLLVLGGGLAGLSAAHASTTERTVLLEKGSRPGGHAITHRQDGHTFDLTGHWLHVRDPQTLAWIQALDPTVRWKGIARKAELYCDGRHMPYPFQSNLHALSESKREHCVQTLPSEHPAHSNAPDFDAFIAERFGEGMAELFFRPYNQKLWGCALTQLRPDCMTRFLPQPSLQTIREGAQAPPKNPQGYNASFYYPEAGGIDHLARALSAKIDASSQRRIALQHRVCAIDLERQEVLTQGPNGEQRWSYDHLISTMPLPELLSCIRGLPEAIKEAAKKLKWSSWRYLDLGLRAPGPRDCHWMYVPDPDIAFFRVGCSSHACPAMAPPGQASLCVELSDRKGALDQTKIWEDLMRVGMLGSPQDIKFVHERRIEYAYVHFDHAYPKVRKEILGWLSAQGVQSIGRYGSWDYGSMEDSLKAGQSAAQRLESKGDLA